MIEMTDKEVQHIADLLELLVRFIRDDKKISQAVGDHAEAIYKDLEKKIGKQ